MAKLVEVPVPEGETYGIDATEVTRSQFAAWLSTNPSVCHQDPWCSWNLDYTPKIEFDPVEEGGYPVVGVDWCDAFAYCKAVGKRLCGKIGGGSVNHLDVARTSKDQWYNACSSGGKNEFSYGDVFDGQVCNGSEKMLKTTAEVASLAGCQSSDPNYSGIFDLSGNAAEWEDNCSGMTGADDICSPRGGCCDTNVYLLACDSVNPGCCERNTVSHEFGFRCCSL